MGPLDVVPKGKKASDPKNAGELGEPGGSSLVKTAGFSVKVFSQIPSASRSMYSLEM